ncbi:hypothetical protein B0H16DRAFT_1605633 [Mycena metata]|uniref:Uncharacterized protein n=1 Tax=Mycena metata TaxID=1033252 RepID=A0AAD7MJY7_9AGAR|nr:hypothetical protein B0H16DRAFT_1605633 [Mycena metata]
MPLRAFVARRVPAPACAGRVIHNTHRIDAAAHSRDAPLHHTLSLPIPFPPIPLSPSLYSTAQRTRHHVPGAACAYARARGSGLRGARIIRRSAHASSPHAHMRARIEFARSAHLSTHTLSPPLHPHPAIPSRPPFLDTRTPTPPRAVHS